MNNTEKIIEKLRDDLKKEIHDFFESTEIFDGQFILNSRITKNSPFEKNELISEWSFPNIDNIPMSKIVMGDKDSFEFMVDARVATWSSQPKFGKELNQYTRSNFMLTVFTKVSYDAACTAMELSDVRIRNRN